MAFIFGNIKCCFCKSIFGVLASVHGYGIYGTELGHRVFYHEECLQHVIENPEQYGHRNIDMAIDITDKKKQNIKHNEEIISDYKIKIKKLKHYCFEEILPGNNK